MTPPSVSLDNFCDPRTTFNDSPVIIRTHPPESSLAPFVHIKVEPVDQQQEPWPFFWPILTAIWIVAICLLVL